MKNRILLLLLVSFSFLGNSGFSQTCPKVFFTPNQHHSNCNDEAVDFSLSICQQGVSATTIVFDHVDWNFGDGTVLTNANLSSSHLYTVSGVYHVTAQVYFVVDGVPCSTTAFYFSNYGNPNYFNASGGIKDPQSYCDLTNFTTTNYFECQIQYLNASLNISQTPPYYAIPQPLPLPPVCALSIDCNVTGVVETLLTYSFSVDGVQVVAPNTPFPSGGFNVQTANYEVGQHVAEIVLINKLATPCPVIRTIIFDVLPPVVDSCEYCFTFRPIPGKRYWASAWVKQDVSSQVITYPNTSPNGISLNVSYVGSSTTVNLYPSGDIIDGWQRIAGDFTVPSSATEINIKLVNPTSLTTYFDDVRVHPFNANMKSFVNDPDTFWLTAELDDNNYATFYEYDKEGKLIRIKKETDRGIVTVKENRSSNPKTN